MTPQLPATGPRVVHDVPPRVVAGPRAAPRGIDEELLAVLCDLVRRVEDGLLRRPADGADGVLLDAVFDHDRYVLCVVRQSHPVSLSPRELQVARMVAAGQTNRAIASGLEISLWTVSTHLRRIFAKLGVTSRAEMVAHVFGTAVVPPQGTPRG